VIEINELIRKAQVGDLVAWESLLAQVYPLALRQARAMLRDPDLAGDAVQNALLKMHTHLHTLVEIAAFSGLVASNCHERGLHDSPAQTTGNRRL